MKKQWIMSWLLLGHVAVTGCAQQGTGYEIQPGAIQTRWAKDVSPANALKEYPRPQLQRKNWSNLNGLWEYAITSKDISRADSYEGKILVPYPIESALSGVKKALQPDQLLWYRKYFSKPSVQGAERVMLNFGAVGWQATVFVNGKEAGHHTGSYTAFSLDITSLLKSGDNELVVKVSNPLEKGIGPRGKQTLFPGKIWYTPSSGIWQTTWLETVPADHIESIRVTPDIDRSSVTVIVKAESDAAVTLQAAGQTVNGKANTPVTIPVSNPRLWSPDDPYIYDLTITLGKDQVKSYFGMRKVEIKKDGKGIERIFLNNRYTYNLGTLDQGFWPDGLYTAPTDEALRFDIEAIKAMGFNTIRKHIKVEPARWYYHADKLGMLVWQDMVQPGGRPGSPLSAESKEQFEKESAEILAQLYNYPSITTWVAFNESWGEYDQARITQWIKNTDPSRLVNGHSGAAIVDGNLPDHARQSIIDKSVNSDMTDVHSYPPPTIPVNMPGKAMVLGEFGGIGVQVPEHQWDDIASGWGYGGTVSAGEMKKRYAVMTDSLVQQEKRGLSASIYTQPFDVESEQNGIMTYDREMIKIPFSELRAIHQKLWPTTKNYAPLTAHVKAKVVDTGSVNYKDMVAAYENGKRDPSFLRQLALRARVEKDKPMVKKASNDYIRQMKDPFEERNLQFIKNFTSSASDAGFPILYNNIAKVNAVLGKDEAESRITHAIENDEIKPYLPGGSAYRNPENSSTLNRPDWRTIEMNAVKKYGQLGKEIVWQTRVLWCVNNKDWEGYEQSLIPWFKEFGSNRKWIGAGLLNGLGWSVFEQYSDPEFLEETVKMTAHALQIEEDAFLLDTHANLLYKLGKKEEAMKYEEKAMAYDPGNEDLKKAFAKMKAGEPTWPQPGDEKKP